MIGVLEGVRDTAKFLSGGFVAGVGQQLELQQGVRAAGESQIAQQGDVGGLGMGRRAGFRGVKRKVRVHVRDPFRTRADGTAINVVMLTQGVAESQRIL